MNRSAKEFMGELLNIPECAEAIKNDQFDRLFNYVIGKYSTEEIVTLRTALESCRIDFLSKLKKIPSKCFYHDDITSIKIPSNIKQIGAVAFAYSDLRTLEFEDGCTYIGQQAFKATELKEVILPDSIKMIGMGAFQHCKDLKNVDLKNVESIGVEAFARTAIEKVLIPKSVKELQFRAFNKEVNLIYEGSEDEFNKLNASAGLGAGYDHVEYLNK